MFKFGFKYIESIVRNLVVDCFNGVLYNEIEFKFVFSKI